MPCLAEMPDLVEVGREFEERGGTVVAVSQDLFTRGATLDAVLPKIEAVIERFGIGFPVVVYDGDLEALSARFDLPGSIPATVAIDASGAVVEVHEDAADAERLRELVRRALGER